MDRLNCPACNHENRTSSRFCGLCGHELQVLCHQCGVELPPASKFCNQCGVRQEFAEDNSFVSSHYKRNILERRQMTVMFVDIVGSTHFTQILDPEDFRTLLRLYQDACDSVIKRYNGYISRYMGDGIVILFGYPDAGDDDGFRAVRAGIEIVKELSDLQILLSGQELKISVRIGIATGLVVAGDVIGGANAREQAVVGDTMHLAARLQTHAGVNELLISETTYRLIRRHIQCESAGTLQPRGFLDALHVYRVAPLAPQFADTSRRSDAPTTTLIGRDRELKAIDGLWQNINQRQGQVVLLNGEAGIGKSRLVSEVIAKYQTDEHHVLKANCSFYMTHSVLHSMLVLFQKVLRLSPGDTETDVLTKLETVIGRDVARSQRIRRRVIEIFRFQQQMVVAPDADAAQVDQPFDAFVELLVATAEDKPLLFVIEDCHWIDPSTDQLLARMVEQISPARMLMLATARPGFSPEWMHHDNVTQIALDRLSAEDAERLIDSRALEAPLSDELRKALVDKSDGVPLFIEELIQFVADSESNQIQTTKDTADGALKSTIDKIPETLRDSLMARLDQLGDAKLVAQISSVIGRHFSCTMLKAVSGIEDSDLRRLVGRLIQAELVYQRGIWPDSQYQFKHSLIQDIAYDSLVSSMKVECHNRIATVFEEQFGDVVLAQPELVARHHALAGNAASAANLWNKASELALQRSANLEAVHHARLGLKQIENMDEGEIRDKIALSLYVNLGASLSGTEGDAVPEVEKAYQQASDILNNLPTSVEQFPLIRGMHAFYLLRGPLDHAIELANQVLQLAQASDTPWQVTEAHRSLGWTHFCFGELDQGKRLIRQALAVYNKDASREYTRRNTIDPGGVGMINLAWAEWFGGSPDTAVRLTREAIALSREINHPFTLAYALCMGAAVFQCRREPEKVIEFIDEVMPFATDRGYRYWTAWGQSLHGWARVQLDGDAAGLEDINQGLRDYRATGATLFVPHILSLQAESMQLLDQPEKATSVLERAVRVEQIGKIGFYSAEVQRLLGTMIAQVDTLTAAIPCFQRALSIARAQRADSLELRVLLSIAQSTAPDNIDPNATTMLASKLDQAREGVELTDYRRARALLADSGISGG